MATREFTVSARFTADTADAQRNLRALTGAVEKNAEEMRRLEARFDAGEITADKFVRAQRRIEREADRLRRGLEDMGASSERSQGRLASFAQFLSSRFVVTLGDVARAGRAAFAAIEEAANSASQRRALSRQVEDLDAFLAKLKEVSRGSVSEAQLISASVNAILRGIPADAIAEILEVARASAIASGESVAKVFDDLALGIARQSTAIIENAGIIVRLEDVYANYAATVGKTADALTAQEKTLALTNEVLRQGEDRVRNFSEAQDEAASAIERGRAAMDDAKNAAARLGIGLIQGIGGGLGAVTVGFTLLLELIIKVNRAGAELLSRIPLIGSAFNGAAAATQRWDDQIDSIQRRIAQWTLDMANGAAATLGFTEAQEKAAAGAANVGEAAESSGPAITRYSQALLEAAGGAEELATASGEAGAGLEVVRSSGERALAVTRQLGQEAVTSAAGFDRLAESLGRAAAAQAAVAAGGRIFGNRVFLPGGGSRFITEPGLTGRSRSESRFIPGKTTII